MALLTIGSYDVPAPEMDTYEVTTEPETETHLNVGRQTIGEFVRWRRRIRWSYRRITAAKHKAICLAMKTNVVGTPMTAVPVTYWDPDTDSFQIGNFIAEKTSPKFHNFSPTAVYSDVIYELVEQ
jgi:hypothetical protein